MNMFRSKGKGRRRKTKACTLMLLLMAMVTLLAFTTESYAAKDWGGYMWKLKGKRVYIGETSGKWRTGIRAKADGGSGDSIHMGSSKSVSNSISTTLGISRRTLNAAFRFDVSRQWSTTASKTYGLTGKKKGSWWAIKYKPVYKKYKYKSQRYTFSDGKWRKTSATRWIVAKRFDHFAYKLVKTSAPK